MSMFVLLALTLCDATTSAPSGWRDIVPLHSTRKDVEEATGSRR